MFTFDFFPLLPHHHKKKRRKKKIISTLLAIWGCLVFSFPGKKNYVFVSQLAEGENLISFSSPIVQKQCDSGSVQGLVAV